MISDEYESEYEENISPVNVVQEENTGTDEENGYGVCPECGRPLKVTLHGTNNRQTDCKN